MAHMETKSFVDKKMKNFEHVNNVLIVILMFYLEIRRIDCIFSRTTIPQHKLQNTRKPCQIIFHQWKIQSRNNNHMIQMEAFGDIMQQRKSLNELFAALGQHE